jgi:predicted Ser/Thr protein kinase
MEVRKVEIVRYIRDLCSMLKEGESRITKAIEESVKHDELVIQQNRKLRREECDVNSKP